jgi:hypothetical protein
MLNETSLDVGMIDPLVHYNTNDGSSIGMWRAANTAAHFVTRDEPRAGKPNSGLQLDDIDSGSKRGKEIGETDYGLSNVKDTL